MATYVCSDIHGCFDKFNKMLRGISFSKEDTLYILGDIIDRGTQNVAVIDYVMENDNVVLLLGNHEYLMLEYYKNKDNYDDFVSKINWFRNGGGTTLKELEEKGEEYTNKVINYFMSLPMIVIEGNFILVHAGLNIVGDESTISDVLKNNKIEDVLWDRSFIQSGKKVEGYTIICGHTPTLTLGKDRIIHRDGVILVDCGCVFNDLGGKLGCLRLDDMQEFYF